MHASKIAKSLLVGTVVCGCAAVAAALARHLLEASDIHLVPCSAFGPGAIYNVEGDDGSPVRVFNVGGSIQSATYLDERYCEPVFAYYRLYDRAFDAALPVHNVCMVGGGGYAYPKHLMATRPDVRLDVVEIDPAVTAIARRYFLLDRLMMEYDLEDEDGNAIRDTDGLPRLGIVEGDGRVYLEQHASNTALPRYDAIMNDSFSGGVPAACLATVEAAQAIRASLVPGGVYLTNVVGALEGAGSRFLRAEAATLATTFVHVYALTCGSDFNERDNVMLVATDGGWHFEGAQELALSPDDRILTDADCPIRELRG